MKLEYLTLCSFFPVSAPKWQLLQLCFLLLLPRLYMKTQIYLKPILSIRDYVEET